MTSKLEPAIWPRDTGQRILCFDRCQLIIARMSNIKEVLTNRFHVAVHLSSNRSQMTSKCGKNKKVAHEAIAECVTDVLTTF